MVFFKRRGGVKRKLVRKILSAVPATCTTSDIQNSTIAYAEAAIGKHASSTVTNGNFYSTGSDVYGTATYGFYLSEIPSDAKFVSLECQIKGGRESSSAGQLTAAVFVHDGGQDVTLGTFAVFNLTTSVVKTITYSGETAMNLIKNLNLGVTVARDGGHIDGVTLTITYDVYE